jgi:hypothetical protein
MEEILLPLAMNFNDDSPKSEEYLPKKGVWNQFRQKIIMG